MKAFFYQEDNRIITGKLHGEYITFIFLKHWLFPKEKEKLHQKFEAWKQIDPALQVGSIEGMSPRDIAPLLPYSYESVTLGVTCLEDVGLCQKIQNGQRSKVVHFELKGKELWDKAQNVLLSPVENRIFCDDIRLDAEYPVCGINALAHYSMLNRDREEMIMMTSKEYRAVKSADVMENPNIYDGNYIIEVWKYPVVSKMGDKSQWVDRLPLSFR